jgi:A/G-specific adenine glycosylase
MSLQKDRKNDLAFAQSGPVDFAQRLMNWQRSEGRHDLPWQGSRDPYFIWVSEIMLQQTQVSTVLRYFGPFIEKFPTVEALAAAELDQVFAVWSGLGYYRRARHLHSAAQCVVKAGGFPKTAVGLAELPGIGRSTAAAVAAFAWGERAAILDGNVKRVLARAFAVEGFSGDRWVEQKLWTLAEQLLPMGTGIEAYTQGLMDLGATVCTRRKPLCLQCPFFQDCVARVQHRQDALPCPRPIKVLPDRYVMWWVGHTVVQGESLIFLERRPEQGIWAGLWSFPEWAGHQDMGADLPSIAEIEARVPLALTTCPWPKTQVDQWRVVAPMTHTFTHYRLHIFPVLCNVTLEGLATGATAGWFNAAQSLALGMPAPVRRYVTDEQFAPDGE